MPRRRCRGVPAPFVSVAVEIWRAGTNDEWKMQVRPGCGALGGQRRQGMDPGVGASISRNYRINKKSLFHFWE